MQHSGETLRKQVLAKTAHLQQTLFPDIHKADIRDEPDRRRVAPGYNGGKLEVTSAAEEKRFTFRTPPP